MSGAQPPFDVLHLWWLGRADAPVPVGTLRWVRALRGVSLEYLPDWLARGVPLSEDLPLTAGEILPTIKDTAVGAVDDARPDRWGERLIAHLDRPARLSIMEYLYFAGDDRFGALGVSTSAVRYEPRAATLLPRLAEVGEVMTIVRRIEAGEPLAERERRLIAPGRTMGGARPKALVEIDGEQWLLKFSEAGEDVDAPLIEHATMTLARQAGIRSAETRAIRLPRGHAVAVRRFDRHGANRVHALSAHVALRAAGMELGYPQLALLLRRRGDADPAVRAEGRRELFRRMVFNILIDNTDDHEKNHVLLADDANTCRLSPAFDMLPAGTALTTQAMIVGRDGTDATIDNALSECASFGLRTDEAVGEARKVAEAVDGWKTHFRDCGVTAADINRLATWVDGPHLGAQRAATLAMTVPRGRRAM